MTETTGPSSQQAFSARGCTAVITGASSGLGAEFARQLAPQAKCLILASRSAAPMEALTKELQSHAGLQVLVCPCDLATDEGRTTLWQKIDTAGLKVNLLINNAGLGDYGPFAEAALGRVRQQIDLNITALTLLSHAFLSRVRGAKIRPAGILNVSSLASAMPIPELSVYAATKSYVLSLSEGLRMELLAESIHVAALCPGPTPTNFGKTAQRNGKDIDRTAQNFIVVAPERVVADGLRALERGKAAVFPGARVALVATVMRILPRPLMRFLIGFRRSQGAGDPRKA